jgi:hypothetical protein
MTQLGTVRQLSGPQTATAVEPISIGQFIEGRDGGIPTDGSWGPVGVAGAGSDRVLGVALKRAAPAGTYDPAGQPLDVADIVGAPPEVPYAVAPQTVAVKFAAAASFGQRLMAAALGQATPYVAAAGANEVQTVTISGSPTGGSFTLTYNGETTAAIAYNATAAQVQAALAALDEIGAGNVTVAGSAGGPYTVTFGGGLADENVPQMTATGSFTGGTTPAVAVATTTPGASTATQVAICVEGNGVAAGDVGWVKLI